MRTACRTFEAATQDDLFLAQGYVTAQDRLWQMDVFRRNAKGELAEILGPSLVWHDKAQRVLQFANSAQRIYSNLAPSDRARFDDYARGVNLFIAQHQNSLPAEFRLLAYRPRPWTGADSIVIGLMMVETSIHTSIPSSRESRFRTDLHNPKLEADLYPVGSWRDHPPTGEVIDWSQPHPAASREPMTTMTTRRRRLALQRRFEDAASLPSKTLQFLRALLGQPACERLHARLKQLGHCRQSHRQRQTAALERYAPGAHRAQYLVHGRPKRARAFTPPESRCPACPSSLPAITSTSPGDLPRSTPTCRISISRSSMAKATFRTSTAQWKPLAVDHEVIKVRGGEDVLLDVQSTRHGPLLNPILTKEMRAYPLKWTLYDPTLNTLPVYQINVASNWAEFSAALDLWCWPTQNVVYSDDQGHIGYHAVGKVPIRNSGTKAFALPLPSLANDPESEWGDFSHHEGSGAAAICRPTFPSTKCPMPSIRLPDFLPQQTRA